MKRKNFVGISQVLLIFGVSLFLHLENEISAATDPDPNYVACQPRNCRNSLNINISFPFYIQTLQNSTCGFHGFELDCNKDGKPAINISENQYVIHQINYTTRIFSVHNTAFPTSNSICDAMQQLKNVTLTSAAPFKYFDEQDLYLLSNCTNSTLDTLQDRKIACGSIESKDGLMLAMLNNTVNLRYALEGCSKNVVVPVEAGGGKVDYVGLLEKGFSLKWDYAPDCTECMLSGGRCGFNRTNYEFRCFCHDRPHRARCKKKHPNLQVILGTVGAAVGISVIAVVFLLVLRCKKRANPYLFSRNNSDPSSNGNVYFGVLVFSYQLLREITNNFNESNELGDGGYGTVYYGKLRDGREVAVKRLYEHNCKRVEHFMNEIQILTRLRHRNLVSLYGCTSRRSRELLLVYEYIPNGTIADHLHGDRAKDNALTWPLRMKIAIETADALAYLHASDIMHRDVKTNNILLDHNFCVKVADFGISRLFPNNATHVSTAPQGTAGYLDPEYHQSYQLTEKSDVYSFGVVLIELISSMPAIDMRRQRSEINLGNYATILIQRHAFDELIDLKFREDSDSDVMGMTTSVAELAFRCLQLERDLRPTMDEVVETLKAIENQKQSENGGGSIELGDALPKKEIKFMSSPNAVTDLWVSSSTATNNSY